MRGDPGSGPFGPPAVYARATVERRPAGPPWRGPLPIVMIRSAVSDLWHRIAVLGTQEGRPETWETVCGIRYLSGVATDEVDGGVMFLMGARQCLICSGVLVNEERERAYVYAKEGLA